jgi:hypothetical protein
LTSRSEKDGWCSGHHAYALGRRPTPRCSGLPQRLLSQLQTAGSRRRGPACRQARSDGRRRTRHAKAITAGFRAWFRARSGARSTRGATPRVQ